GAPANVVNGAGQTSTVTQTGNNPTTVNPGEQNQPAGTTTLTENAPGVIGAGSMTFTLSQPATGMVQFSTSPTVTTTAPAAISAPVITATANSGPGTCAAGTYYYEVTALTVNGETTPSAPFSVVTTGGGSSVTVTWNPVTGATNGYSVYRSPTGAAGTFKQVNLISGSATSPFTDTACTAAGATAPTTNTATIPVPAAPVATAQPSGGVIPAGTTKGPYSITALTAAGETTISGASNTVLTTSSGSSIVLNWTAVPGATGYNVYYPVGCGKIGTVVGNGTTTFTDPGNLACGAAPPGTNTATIPAPVNVVATANNAAGTLTGTHCYEATSLVGGGETTPSASSCATITGAGTITLTWTAVPGATGYNIYGRPALPGGVYGLIGTTTASPFTDTGTPAPGAAPPIANTTAGVAPTVGTVCSLSFDRKSCTVNVGAAGSVRGSSVTLGPIFLDVSSDATVGTAVNVTVTGSPAFIVLVSTNTIAYIARVVVGVADQPTIYINYNDQSTGEIKLAESAAGFFNGGTGTNNSVGLCLITGETFTRAPWIIVTSGNLTLNNGAGVAVSQIIGNLFTDPLGNSCVQWTIFAASTTASTIEIRGSDSTGAILPEGIDNGPRLSVGPTLKPGTTQGVILIGSQANVLCGNQVFGSTGCTTALGATGTVGTVPAFSSLVSMATRAYKSGVTVSVVGNPPFMAQGSDPLAANIQITETLNGQLKAGDTIVVQLLPRSTRLRSDVLMNTGSTNQLPIVTTNASSGLLVSPVSFTGAPLVNCQPAVPGVSVCAFTFTVTQQAFGPTLGQITISNMDYIVAPDAALGPVQVNVFSFPAGTVGTGGGVLFNQVVENAIIGTPPLPPALTKTSAASALGKTQNPADFSVRTKVVRLATHSNNIVTVRIQLDPQLVGQLVVIQVAHKSSSGVWSGFATLTSRLVGSDGFAYYYASAHSAQWNSYRGWFAGNAMWAASYSQTVQARWL
ncbi:MAG TPA: hypothetical protein VFG00_10015, partial [Acidothermaceae bacterium]|nr:hypothetical protein [Acidothermaceae bacterium]